MGLARRLASGQVLLQGVVPSPRPLTAAHDAYDTHLDHLRLIAECGSLWRRVQVYDVVPA